MSEDFKDSIVMLPHCGNCGHLFRLDEVAIVDDGFYSKYVNFKKTYSVLPRFCPRCKQRFDSILFNSPEYFIKNGEFYSKND